MKKLRLFLLSSLIFAIGVFAYGAIAKASIQPVEPVTTVSTPTVEGLLAFTNKERQKAGLPTLKIDQRLNTSAQLKSDDMNANKYIEHASPITGRHGYEYIRERNIPNCRGSENLTRNIHINTSQRAIESLMTSPAHKAAILNEKATLVGFGVSGEYITQHFCIAG